MANLGNRYKLLCFVFVFMTSLLRLAISMSSHECATRAGSSDHCVCSLSSAVQSIIEIVKGSHVESRLSSFRCPHFIQLPFSLTKTEEFVVVPKENQEHGRTRKHHSHFNEETNLNQEYQNEEEEEPEEERPRYSVDSQGRRTGPRYRKRRFRRSLSRLVNPSPNHRRFKRQVALGVPTADTFSKVVAKMPSPGDQHQYVPLGSPATLQCFNPEKQPHFKKWPNKRFTWTYSDGRPVTTSQMAVDKKTGELTIHTVQLQDTNVYNCTVDFINKKSEIEMTEKFTHQIDVVSEPAFWLQVSMYYTTDSDSCFPGEIYDIEKSISPWVHAYACENCEVRNVSLICQHSEGVTKVLIQMIITTMGIESKIPTVKFGSSYACPMTCSEKLHLKLLEIIDASLVKMFLLPIELIDEEGDPVWYQPVSSSMTTQVVEGCLSGFYQAYKLCFPCAVGKYSPNGKADCLLCPKGSYQNKQGSSGCIRCAEGLSTLSEGSTMEYSCLIPTAFDGCIDWIQIHWILAIVIFLLITLILKIVVFLWCFPASKVSLIIRMVLLCGGCCHDCCDCCANCFKRPVMPKKSSKKLRRDSSLLLTTDTTTTDATSESDLADNAPKAPKRNLRAKLNEIGRKASKFIPKSAKRAMKNTLSDSNLNKVTSRLLPSIPKKLTQMISEEDEDDNPDDYVPLYKRNTLPAKNAANDGVIEQLKGIKNIGNDLRKKMRRQDGFRV